ncbi:MAG: HAD family hydrolase [Deltaproteobacteria bacterium]|nr:HAD family hydrolase [Deltaproteobacteria bacterium]
MRFKAVLFDLDGTLLNTIDDLTDSMNVVLKQWGFPEHDTETFKYFVGDGMEDIVRRSLPEDQRDSDRISQGMEAYSREYQNRYAKKTQAYDGVQELLDGLTFQGIKLAILSNKPHDSTVKMVEQLLGDWTFEPVFGVRPSVPKKPDPGAALEAAELLRVEPKDILYLGDSNVDMLTARGAGMYAVGALWGFRTAEEILSGGAQVLVKHPADILAWI